MSLLNLFFPSPHFLPHRSIHFSFTHQQIQLNPHSNSPYVHINYSALHQPQPPVAMPLPWQQEVAVLISETPPRTLMQALGQVICTAAGHRLTPKNKMAAIPFIFSFATWESLFLSLWDLNNRESTHVLAWYLFDVMICVLWIMWDILGVIGVAETHHRAELSESLRDQLPVLRI